jgi:hypothetical protein
VLDAFGNVIGASEQLASAVEKFFVRLRNGPLDRRKEDDPNYKGSSGGQAAPAALRADNLPLIFFAAVHQTCCGEDFAVGGGHERLDACPLTAVMISPMVED